VAAPCRGSSSTVVRSEVLTDWPDLTGGAFSPQSLRTSSSRSRASSDESPRVPWRTGRQHGSEVSAECQRCNDLSSSSTARVGSSRPNARPPTQANPVTSGEAPVDAGGNTVIIFDGCANQRTPGASAGQEVIASTRGACACPVGSLVHSESVSLCSASSAARRAASVCSRPLRRRAERRPRGRHHRVGTPTPSSRRSASRSAGRPVRRRQASSRCSNPVYGCAKRSAS